MVTRSRMIFLSGFVFIAFISINCQKKTEEVGQNANAPSTTRQASIENKDPTTLALEVVMGDMIEGHRASGDKRYSAYFIADESLFSSEFISNLRNQIPALKPISKCKSDGTGLIDTDTGGYGKMFSVKVLKMKPHESAEIRGDWYSANMASASSTYILKWENQGWKIVSKNMGPIS